MSRLVLLDASSGVRNLSFTTYSLQHVARRRNVTALPNLEEKARVPHVLVFCFLFRIQRTHYFQRSATLYSEYTLLASI